MHVKGFAQYVYEDRGGGGMGKVYYGYIEHICRQRRWYMLRNIVAFNNARCAID